MDKYKKKYIQLLGSGTPLKVKAFPKELKERIIEGIKDHWVFESMYETYKNDLIFIEREEKPDIEMIGFTTNNATFWSHGRKQTIVQAINKEVEKYDIKMTEQETYSMFINLFIENQEDELRLFIEKFETKEEFYSFIVKCKEYEKQGKSVVYFACRYGHINLLQLLERYFQDTTYFTELCNIKDNENRTVFMASAQSINEGNRAELLKFIIKHIDLEKLTELDDNDCSALDWLYIRNFNNDATSLAILESYFDEEKKPCKLIKK